MVKFCVSYATQNLTFLGEGGALVTLCDKFEIILYSPLVS
jgi:hypothetical protein